MCSDDKMRSEQKAHDHQEMSLQKKARNHLERAVSLQKSFGNNVPWTINGERTHVSLSVFKDMIEESRDDNVPAFLNFCRELVTNTYSFTMYTDDSLIQECLKVAMMLYGIAEECESNHHSSGEVYPHDTDWMQAQFSFRNYSNKYKDLLKPFRIIAGPSSMLNHINSVLEGQANKNVSRAY